MESEAALGARVRSMREALGIKGQDLASAIGLDPSAVSNIERGKRAVKTDELARIAAALRVSPLALLDEHSLPARMPIAPRAGGGDILSGAAYQRLLALAELHQVLEDAGVGTSPHLGDVPPLASEGTREQRAGALAEWAIQRLAVTAEAEDRFAALAAAIENEFGVDVLVEEYPGDALAGATICDRRFPLLFVNAAHPTTRSLFTLAHELGHLLAGHGEGITLDDTLADTNEDERIANSFASQFLMPVGEVRSIIEDRGRGIESLAYLCHRYGVSFESLIYRLNSMGELNGEGVKRLQEVGWQGILKALERQQKLDPRTRRSLAARGGSRPVRKSPAWLVSRALAGYRKGAVSIRPIAGLMHEEDDVALIRALESGADADAQLADGWQVGPDSVAAEDAPPVSPV
jgi:Zn-dependent peptidase ImmA (M78 family)/DNA-binding Xre family transcriptional regulator